MTTRNTTPRPGTLAASSPKAEADRLLAEARHLLEAFDTRLAALLDKLNADHKNMKADIADLQHASKSYQMALGAAMDFQDHLVETKQAKVIFKPDHKKEGSS